MILDFENFSEGKKYKTMSNTIFPRPIAWITTKDGGIVNLAPFSYFTPLSSEPPLVIVSIATKEDGTQKDTFANILKHKVCTISLAHKDLLDDLKNSSEELPHEISECEKFGIKMKDIMDDFPPMVASAKCALFCKFIQTIDLGNDYQPIILEIKEVYIEDGAIDGKNHIHLENIGRVGMEFLVDSVRVQ